MLSGVSESSVTTVSPTPAIFRTVPPWLLSAPTFDFYFFFSKHGEVCNPFPAPRIAGIAS